jgi:hypothetical protein
MSAINSGVIHLAISRMGEASVGNGTESKYVVEEL